MAHDELSSEERAMIPISIIHSKPQMRAMVGDIVAKHKILRNEGAYANAQEYLQALAAIPRDQPFILAEGASAVEVARGLNERHIDANLIVVEKKPELYPDQAVKMAKRAHELMCLRKDPLGSILLTTDEVNRAVTEEYSAQLKDQFELLREQGKIWRPLRIAFIGGSQSTNSILERVVGQQWVEKVLIQSKYYANTPPQEIPYLKLFENVRGGGKIYSVTLEEMTALQPDVVLVTTGQHRENFMIPRPKVNEMDLIPGWNRMEKGLEAIAKMPNEPLTIISSNPVESYLMAAENIYGLKKSKLISIASDGMRAQRKAWDALVALNADFREFPKEKLEVDVIGRHGAGAIAKLDRRVMQGKDKFNPLSLVTDRAAVIDGPVRKEGVYTRQLAEDSGINYKDFPEAVAEGLHFISHLGRHPSYSWCTAVSDAMVREVLPVSERKNGYAPFLFLPTHIHHTPLRASLRRGFELTELPAEVMKDIAMMIKEEYADVDRIRHECGYK